MFLLLFQQACKNKNNPENQTKIAKEEDTTKKTNVEKYFSTLDIPYLLEEEIDSIIANEEKIKNDKNYRGQFIRKAKGRKGGIRKLGGQSQIPAPFRRYLLPFELTSFNKDSLSDFIILYELYKKRQDKIRSISKYSLTHDEIQKLIQGSYKDSIYYKELAYNRRKRDSINYWIAYHKRTDSLQRIIHPIDSKLPFGPKTLGKLVANNSNEISFTYDKDAQLDAKNIKVRKFIYDTWLYFLKLHPNADADLAEGYTEKLMPRVNTYEYIDLGINIQAEDQMEDPKSMHFNVRIANLGIYEVYYSTTGIDFPFSCSNQGKKEEDCCFGEDFYCESTGYIILYDRKKQHSVIISAFILQNAGQGYLLNTQFFYINNNTIHIYEGRFENGGALSKIYSIDIKSNGNVIVNEECGLVSEINKEKYNREGLSSVSLRFKHNEKEFSTKRDSVINNIQYLVSHYPLNLVNFKAKNILQVDTKLIDSIFQYNKFYQFSRNQERLHSFYTLPYTTNLNKINLGSFEYWGKGLLQNFQKSWICSNIDIDSDDIEDYKLPSLGIYEVYLSIGSDNKKGILTLYNPTTNQANVINVLEDTNSRFRFFNINENNQIEIYQGLKNENSNNEMDNIYNVIKTHMIEVSSDREIIVHKIKN